MYLESGRAEKALLCALLCSGLSVSGGTRLALRLSMAIEVTQVL